MVPLVPVLFTVVATVMPVVAVPVFAVVVNSKSLPPPNPPLLPVANE